MFQRIQKWKMILIIGICSVGIAGCAEEKKETGAAMITPTPIVEESEEVTQDADVESTETVTEEAKKEAIEETTEGSVEETTEEMLEEPVEITIRMVGDILLHDPVEKYALQEDGSYDFTAIFEPMKEEISQADLAIVNQEVIIGGEKYGITGYPSFNAPFAVGHALAQAGFDVVCHGTNHALDKGKNALLDCLQFWETEYPRMGVLGIHESQEDQDEIYIYEQNGIKIAILNYTYGTNGIPLPQDMPYAVDMLAEEKVISDIQEAESLADFTIVCPHWGTEYVLEQTKEQERWADIFAQHGVDLVLGTHPHVIEPVEMLVVEETGHEMLVYYSLGNFVNWTGSSGAGIANRMVGGMADVTIGRGEDGTVEIKDYGVKALVTHLEERVNGVCTMELADYTAQLAAQNAIIHQDPAFTYDYCVDLCDKVWGDLW